MPWRISLDGKRFLMMKESSAAATRRKIIMVTDGFEELQQKVPVSK